MCAVSGSSRNRPAVSQPSSRGIITSSVTTWTLASFALDKVKDANVQVVTLDVMMPRLDGWETAGRLRDDPETAHIKVVLLSARAQEADLQRGEKIGVDAYLTK